MENAMRNSSQPLSRKLRWPLGVVTAAACAVAVAAPAAQAAWTIPSGTVLTNTSGLSGVSCVGSASACMLVGFQSGASTDGLTATWNGSSFTGVTPASSTSELYGTSCVSTLCIAVGTDSSGTPVPHAESWNGSSWSNTTAATPSGSTYAQMLKVSCPTTSFCAAVGWYDNGSIPLPFIEHYNGTSFSLQSLTLPNTTVGAKLIGVSCASASACKAVGYIEVTGQPRKTLVATWNGTAWATETSANPSGANLAQLHGVSCTSSSACTAVGQYLDGSNVQHSLAEAFNGSSWALQTVPDPGGGATDPGLNDVSCVSSSSCEAVGGYTSSAPHATPMAAAWNGSSWTLQSVPNPSGASDSTLYGVSCPATCMAVGVALYDGSIGITGPRPTVALGP
jgi:hypothetical protein